MIFVAVRPIGISMILEMLLNSSWKTDGKAKKQMMGGKKYALSVYLTKALLTEYIRVES